MKKFIITDGTNYIYLKNNHTYDFIMDKDLATWWSTKEKANNVLRSSLGKELKSKCKIVEDDDETTAVNTKEEKSKEENLTKEEPKKHMTVRERNEMMKNAGKVPEDNGEFDEWENKISYLSEIAKSVEKRKEELNNILSEIDQEINDINHYIEFGVFNAYQGWLVFAMLKRRLEYRRRVKDELHLLTNLSDSKVNSQKLENLKKKDHTYTPRRMPELFENERGVDIG